MINKQTQELLGFTEEDFVKWAKKNKKPIYKTESKNEFIKNILDKKFIKDEKTGEFVKNEKNI